MDREQLEKIIPIVAQRNNFRLEIVEKDYYLTVALNNIESHLSNELVFKGGTLLNKIHLNYYRLSEDLDFTYFGKGLLNTRTQRSKAIAPIREKMGEFIKGLGLKSDKPQGEGFNNSTQYIFYVNYPSFITGKAENIKIEVSLRQLPVDRPVRNAIKHFYQDPFTGEDLIPKNSILSLSLNEAVAEKLKAAITRRDAAIRDYYDLRRLKEAKFDFHNKRFIEIFKEKLSTEGYRGNFSHNFGLSQGQIEILRRQIESDLMPVICADERFELNKVFKDFNEILGSI